jgi:probable F420-dependent oxidoreductase
MRVGLITPIVSANVRHPPHAWERDAGPEELATVARAADDAGLWFLTCSEHAAVPASVTGTRGSRYWDPVATLSFLAAHTSRARLLPYVAVLGYSHPLQTAKRYATLDRLSSGRLVLGVGVGSLEEEFALLGADFEARGRLGDDARRAIRAGLSSPTPSYRGTEFSFEGFIVDPQPVQVRVPIWVGGRTRRSLRRARELADGWAPFQTAPENLKAWLATEADVPDASPFEIVPAVGPPLDPAGNPESVLSALREYAAAGATGAAVRLFSTSAAHIVDQIWGLAELAAGETGSAAR